MAKDPAFLFYPGDWLGGTMLLTRHQKGCYIDLLMAQFNKGPLSLDQIKTLLGQDQAVWTVLQEKFIRDSSGKYYNEKMAAEIEKRKNFVSSRSNGKAGKKKSYDKSHDNHIDNHTEDVNENEDAFLKKGTGEKLLIPQMQTVFKNHLPAYPIDPDKDFQPLLAIANFICKQLSGTGQPTANMALVIAEWEKLSTWIAADNFYNSKSLKTISTHIQEIFQKKKHGTVKQPTGKAGKSAGANELLNQFKTELGSTG